MRITLRPIGKVDNYILEELREKLAPVFGCSVEIKPGIDDFSQAYDPKRKQYLSSLLLAFLNSIGKEKEEKLLGIADVDLYAPWLNFVFGEADIASGVAIISLCRLRQEFYGLPPDETLFLERALKEMVHELGHTFGLRHCSNSQCVMHFSNCLADTDWKQATFCNRCRPKLSI